MNKSLISKSVFLLMVFAFSAAADDITTLDGKTYTDIKIVAKDTTSLTILARNGGAKIIFSQLSPELQKKYGFDPEIAQKQLATDKEKQDQEDQLERTEKILKANRFLSNGTILQVVTGGIMVELYVKKPGEEYGHYRERVFVSCDTKGLVDSQSWERTIWKIGTYSYPTVGGTTATIEKYTDDPKEAFNALDSREKN